MCCMTDFTIYKWGVKGSTLHEHVIMMFSVFPFLENNAIKRRDNKSITI